MIEMKILVIFSSLFWFGVSQELVQDCEYQSDTRTYVCNGIFDAFPNKFYGNYHLKCVNCKLATFSNKTFPYTNSLVSFNASESAIKFITPKAFSSFSNAQYIYLQHNEISEIWPGAFSGLRLVYEIHLEYNHLTTLIPGFLEDLQANSVDLSNNRIRELPKGAFVRSLAIMNLDLSHNHITRIHEDAFLDLENLEMLNLEHNKICHLPLGLFRRFNLLTQLNLADNKLRNFNIGTFSGLKNLNMLNLANNTIAVFDGDILLPINRLSKLDLSGNGIYYFDAHNLHVNVPTMRILRIDNNLLSCSLLGNIIKYFKKFSVEIYSISGHYYIQNINGIACTDVQIQQRLEFDTFIQAVKKDTKKDVGYC